MTSLVEKLQRIQRPIFSAGAELSARVWFDIIEHARRQEANLDSINVRLPELEARIERALDLHLDTEQPPVRISRTREGVEIYVGGELRFTIL